METNFSPKKKPYNVQYKPFGATAYTVKKFFANDFTDLVTLLRKELQPGEFKTILSIN